MMIDSLFLHKIQKGISSLSKRIQDAQSEHSFLTGQLPRGVIDIADLEKKIKSQNDLNATLKKSVNGDLEDTLPTHEKVNRITRNAQKFQIHIDQSETVFEDNRTVYILKFYTSFSTLNDFINKSYDNPGSVTIKRLQLANQNGQLQTVLEFNL